MGVKLIQESTLTDIADAIRGVDGTTALIDPSDYAARISTFSKGEVVITNPIQSIEEAVKAGSLDCLSWKSIEIIADALAAGDITASDANGLLGLYKRFSYGNVTCYAFVIGILQDYLDTAPRGLTFWCVGSYIPFFQYGKQLPISEECQYNSIKSNVGGWGNSDILRPALQSGGTIYNNMPSDMTAVMKPKTTYYGPTYNSTSTDVSSVIDIMFILSAKELYNVNTFNTSSYNRPFWEYEGTGAAHNEQYQLFANKGITQSSLILQTVQPCAWLRTCHHGMYGDSEFQYIDLNGRMSDSLPTRTNGVTPCFCV